MRNRVIGGLGLLVISLGTPVNAQQVFGSSLKEKCLITEENLISHTTIIPDIYNSKGKTVMRYMNKQSDEENKPRCGMQYDIESIKPYGTGILINYKKGVKIDGE